MRIIPAQKISETVGELCLEANFNLREDVLRALKSAHGSERNRRARKILDAIIRNASVASKEKLAICQDTGLPCVFAQIGQEVRIKGDFAKAVHKGIEAGYKGGSLRNSIIGDPLRRGKPGYAPALIHTEVVPGNRLQLTVLPKGFGCENKAQLRMFNPTAPLQEIKKFIVDAVKAAGPDACPPYVVGVGIGGTADYAMLLAKKALLKPLARGRMSFPAVREVRNLERDFMREINRLNIGPMGLGGKNTCLAVNILTFPTHIAGLPVGVNISCHALRSATAVL
jgi:fumarate hydratase subunit alpha